VQGQGCPATAPAGASPATSTFEPLPQGLAGSPFQKGYPVSSNGPFHKGHSYSLPESALSVESPRNGATDRTLDLHGLSAAEAQRNSRGAMAGADTSLWPVVVGGLLTSPYLHKAGASGWV
jgi:hypothetical protein